MERSELLAKARDFIQKEDVKNGVTAPIYNLDELIGQLADFWEPSEESYRVNAEKMVGVDLPKTHSKYHAFVEEQISFWMANPPEEAPILRYYPDEADNRCGAVANRLNRYMTRPADWKNRIKLAKKMR